MTLREFLMALGLNIPDRADSMKVAIFDPAGRLDMKLVHDGSDGVWDVEVNDITGEIELVL